MSVSSNTLFNFMRKYEYLVKALQDGLWPRYSVEPFWNGKHFAIPMLCFCDIPLSQIKEHIENYGSYGIGVTKDFARNHKITPVIYIDSSSNIMSKFDYFLDKLGPPTKDPKKMIFEEYMLYYAKKVKGMNKDKGKTKFYNEREWRYIPTISDKIHMEIFDNLEEANSKSQELSVLTEKQSVELSPNDIKYIFVKTESEKKKLCKKLNQLYNEKISNENLDLLKTKILTIEQIKNDF